jgi:hypothetical protein
MLFMTLVYKQHGSSQGIQVYNTCLFSISPELISNTRMFIYFVHCMLIIMHKHDYASKFREMLFMTLVYKQHDVI